MVIVTRYCMYVPIELQNNSHKLFEYKLSDLLDIFF